MSKNKFEKTLNRREALAGASTALTFLFMPKLSFAGQDPSSSNILAESANYSNYEILYRNEHPLGISDDLKAQLKKSCDSDAFHHYKFLEEQNKKLKAKIREKISVPEQFIFIAPGAGPTLERILITIMVQKKTFAISDPDFYYLFRVTDHLGIKTKKVPLLQDYSVDLDGLKKTKADFIYLSNPHVPFGRAKTKEEIRIFLKSVEKDTIVVIDEAYSEFSPRFLDVTSIDLVKEFKNLIVVRTFSKIYGLAALRIGYYLTQNKNFTEYFTIYTTSAFSAKAARLALDDGKRFRETFAFVEAGRLKIKEAARKMGINCIESETNFITLLTNPDQKKSIVAALEKRKYVFSPLSKLPQLRISLGSLESIADAVRVIESLKI